MDRWKCSTVIFFLLVLATGGAGGAGPAGYAPAKVVYDVTSPDAGRFAMLLDRVSHLQNLYASDPFAASIVVVIHEGAISLLASRGHLARPDLIERAHSLTMGEIIQFRLCRASATLQGFGQSDFARFMQLVPMADAEIVRLQQQGYAYLN